MTFFDNGPGFRDIRVLSKMVFSGRLQEFIYLFRCLDPSILRLTLITNTSHENAKLNYVSINK